MTRRLLLLSFAFSSISSGLARRHPHPLPLHLSRARASLDAGRGDVPGPAAAPLELRMSRVVAGPLFAARLCEERLRRARVRRRRPRAAGRRGRIRTGGPSPSTAARVTVTYKVFGDRVDGTYLAIDTTHAHINMPAAIMWARGLDDRPATLTFAPPAGAQLAGRDAAASGIDARSSSPRRTCSI